MPDEDESKEARKLRFLTEKFGKPTIYDELKAHDYFSLSPPERDLLDVHNNFMDKVSKEYWEEKRKKK